ncbi:MAG: hypothetical protein K0S23_2560 [Fluviicola sp.]|jgi:hypothetical protein|uniref:hypothetical protein n=1 Tax=Fluviicola sp. TaxID=1917219 RepID=UPI002612966F|nr:hypothetical protein [Fluviicola sp.]MDF3028253.1 hypothetical protein [Fluviicola sp.]
MEEQHERLFDLIESKSFGELSEEEKSFVLNHLTEMEYGLQRKVISATAALEYDSEEPLALNLPEKNTPFLKRTIPLYKALIGAACLVLLFVVGNRKSYSLNWHFTEHPLEISLTGGASSMQIIHDTIIERVPFISASRIIHDTITLVQNTLQQTEKRMLEAGNTIVYPELTEKLLETKSQSYKEDQTTAFLPSVTVVNTMK